MTSLKSRVTLELLNKGSRRNGLTKGFTLVELMIVIVIVGVLSAVALPSFLNQQNKAKLTEAVTKVSAILKNAQADYQINSDDDDAIRAALAAADKANAAGKFIYNTSTVAGNVAVEAGDALAPEDILIVSAFPGIDGGADQPDTADAGLQDAAVDGDLDEGKIFGCINLATGKIDVARNLADTVNADVDGNSADATEAGLDCAA